MEKQRIYWWIQHLDEIGGTEMVSVDLANHLCDEFDVTLIVSSEIVKDPVYKLDERIKFVSLNIPHDVIRADQYAVEYKHNKQRGKRFKLFWNTFLTYTFKRGYYKRAVKKIIKKDPGVLICSSGDSYYFAPRGIKAIYHYHFNSRLFFSSGNKIIMSFSRKPNYSVFLSKTTLDIVSNKRKKIKDSSTYIYNPVRFEPTLDTINYGNRIIFVGRFVEQKNPLFAIEIAKFLKNKGLDFKLDMYGNGGLVFKMENLIKEYNLEQNVFLHEPIPNIKDELLHSDLLLVTSKYEGLVLVKAEANSMSTPVISTNWGDTVYEISKNGEDGFVIDSENAEDFANKIIEVLSNKNELISLKESSYESSKSFSYENIIPQWISLIHKINDNNAK